MAAQDRARLMVGAKLLAALLPVTCGLLGVVLSNLPVTLFGGLVPPPLLGFIPIYFWCLVRPDLMTPAATFAIGLLQDVMAGGPPGVWTLSFVVAYAIIQRQRDAFAGLSGVAAVLGFAAAALVVCATAYLTTTLYYWHAIPLGPVVAELAVTVLFYVPGAFVVGALHRRLVGPLRSDF
jgi:rod shape-determining protein MreD